MKKISMVIGIASAAALPFFFYSNTKIKSQKLNKAPFIISSNSESSLNKSSNLNNTSMLSCNHKEHDFATHIKGKENKKVLANNFVKNIFEKQKRKHLTLDDLPESNVKTKLKKINKTEITEKALENIVELDPPVQDFASLHVGFDGKLFYACSDHVKVSEVAEEDAIDFEIKTVPGTPVSTNTPPARSSKPGSRNVIYLNFTGEKISGTWWNRNYGVEEWNTKPYDRDGDLSKFSPFEQEEIIKTWALVAENYATFDVNVTTIRPAEMTKYTCHVVISDRYDYNRIETPLGRAGGVALSPAFGRKSYYLISFVKPSSYRQMGGAISHEVGHNLNLSHDGKDDRDYYGGHGSGWTSWCPIMGNTPNDSLAHWSKGEYTGATNKEDDLHILANQLGYKSDDHADWPANASTLEHKDGIINDQGVIGRTGEKDVFKFIANAGPVTLNVHSYKGELPFDGGNLDIVVELLDSQRNVIRRNDPEWSTDVEMNFQIPTRGEYFLRIKPGYVAGFYNAEPTGYSIYGSIGHYFISGSFTPYSNSAPQIEKVASSNPASISIGESTDLNIAAFDPDFDTLTYFWEKQNGPGKVTFSNFNSESTSAEFSEQGTYKLKVTVSDGALSTSSSVTVTVNPEKIVKEHGTFNIAQHSRNQWNQVNLDGDYNNPVIIFSPLTKEGGQPAHVRVKNVNGGSFEWQIEEWDYIDGYHVAEKVDYIVMESGIYTLADGRKFIAGNISAGDSFASYNFAEKFTQTPVVVTQLSSAIDAKPAVVRMRNITAENFEVLIQSEEGNDKNHENEIVSFIAVEPGVYNGSGIQESGTTERNVNHNWLNIGFSKTYEKAPSFFSSIQSYFGPDTAGLRISNLDSSGVSVQIEEEQSLDEEVYHTKENVGYILFDLNN